MTKLKSTRTNGLSAKSIFPFFSNILGRDNQNKSGQTIENKAVWKLSNNVYGRIINDLYLIQRINETNSGKTCGRIKISFYGKFHCLSVKRLSIMEQHTLSQLKTYPKIVQTFPGNSQCGFDLAVIPKQAILHIAQQMDFVGKHEHLIFIGPGGVGKTHLAIALGLTACQRGIRTLHTTAADMINTLVASQVDHGLGRALKRFTAPGLLIIDELGYMPLDKYGRDLFFQVISKRADTGSVILTTNKAFKDWGEVFQDNAVATAIAERLVEKGDVIKIEGSSYRVKQRRQKAIGLDGLQDKK